MRVQSKNRTPPTKRWFPLRYHPDQAKAWNSKARFINLACGRRSGKTELARRKIITSLAIKKPWSNPIYFYALPTYNQAKRVAWKELMELLPPTWIDTANVMDLYIKTIFGSELYVLGMDQPQRIEGLGYDGGVVDEACDHKPGSFDLSIRPALSDREGWCWRIGVPKRTGIGSREYKLAFDRGYNPDFEDVESYSWMSSDILSTKEIEAVKAELDPKDYREQYEASWEQAGGLIFYTFVEKEHSGTQAEEICQYRPHLPLHIGMDFNVDPMSWVIGQIIPDHPLNPNDKTLIILDELFVRNTNTPQCLEEIYKRYEHHKGRVIFSGDAASRQRRSSASMSDYLHIANFNKWPDKKINIPRSNPGLANRFSVTNAVFKNADSQVRCYVHPRCKRLIVDLMYRAYKEGTSQPNDSGDVGHITDALGYLMWSEYPMKINGTKPQAIAIQGFG